MPPNFTEKTFANSHKTVKFAKVFSLESFPLYDMSRLPPPYSWEVSNYMLLQVGAAMLCWTKIWTGMVKRTTKWRIKLAHTSVHMHSCNQGGSELSPWLQECIKRVHKNGQPFLRTLAGIVKVLVFLFFVSRVFPGSNQLFIHEKSVNHVSLK